MTNALFAAKIYATKQCFGYEKIQGFWVNTIDKIFPGFLRNSVFFFLDYMDFADITVTIYVIQLFSQPIYALIFSFPLKIWEVNFQVLVGTTATQQFKTISDENSNDEDNTDFKTAVMVLAEVNRMEALVSFDLNYRRAMIKRLPAETNDKLKIAGEAIEIGLAVLARSAARFCLKGLVQNCLQVNLQVSMQAISKGAMPDHFDFFNGVNLGVTLLAVFLDIPDMISIYMFVKWLQKEVKAQLEGMEHGRLKTRISTMECRFWRIRIYFGLYVIMAGYALLRLWMALVVCKDGEWNLSDSSWNNLATGCVAFDRKFSNSTRAWNCSTTESQCSYQEVF